jgi:outer membrane protein assembly factor BamB
LVPGWAADWANWRGPRLDGISTEIGLARSWPADGPKALWRAELPGGYSSVSISSGRLYTHVRDGADEAVLCFDVRTGRKRWEHRYPVDYDAHPTLDKRFKSGPRATPTVEGGRVYSVGTMGALTCLDARTGALIWKKELMELAGRACPEFGYCGSVLISGNLLFLHPGGKSGNSLMALNKKDGSLAWKAFDDAPGYSSPILYEFQGERQLVHFTAIGLVAVKPETGAELWRYDWRTNFDLNCATPIYADGRIFLSSNYGRGCAMIQLKRGAAPDTVFKNQLMHNHISTSVLYRGYVYGFNTDRLTCMDPADGTVKWESRGLGRGSLLAADGMLFVLGERGDLVLLEATPTAYTERSRFKALQGTSWAVPVLSDGRLYLRNEKSLIAVDVRR